MVSYSFLICQKDGKKEPGFEAIVLDSVGVTNNNHSQKLWVVFNFKLSLAALF